MSAALVVLVLLGLGLPALPADAAASAPIPDLQCGQLITTSVKLRADLTCVDPIVVARNAPFVTIDLGGHTFTGLHGCSPVFGDGCGLNDPSGRASIVNGSVVGSVSGGKLTRVHVTGMVTTGMSGNVTLRHSVVDNGVYQYGGASIHDSTIGGGIYIDDTFRGLRLDIVGNTIVGGSRPGILLYVEFDFDRVGGRIEGNQIRGSAGPGIQIGGQTYSMGPTTIANNTIVDNTGDGISMPPFGSYDMPKSDNGAITVAGNVARRNGGHGIVVGTATGPHPGVIDGGGNRARDNALGPQCLGVRCGSGVDTRLVPDIEWHNRGPMEYGVPLGPDQLDATSSVPGTFTYSPPEGAIPRPALSTLTAHFTPADLVTYQPVDRSVELWVAPPPRITPTITWSTPTPMAYGQPLGPDQLNATASVPGTFTYTPAAGTALTAGPHQLDVHFVPDDMLLYFPTHASVTVMVEPASGATTFASPIDLGGPAPHAPADVDLADLDGDGHLDLVTPGAGAFGLGGRIRVALGAGDGTFPAATDRSIPLGDGGHELAIGDVDGDGHPDLVASSAATQTISVVRGLGNGTFGPGSTLSGGFGLGDLQLADLDGDHDLDILESNFQAPTVSVLLGHGDGTFDAKMDHPVGLGPLGMAVTDLDGDHDLDVAVPNALGDTVSVLAGRGDGTFAPARQVPVGAGPTGVAAIDVDDDGDQDLAVSNGAAATVTLLVNDGGGGFTPAAVHPAEGGVGELAVADVNGDGRPDVVSVDGSGSIGIWVGTGIGLRPDVTYGASPNALALAVGDLDEDGRPDVVVGCGLGGKTILLLNRTQPPSP